MNYVGETIVDLGSDDAFGLHFGNGDIAYIHTEMMFYGVRQATDIIGQRILEIRRGADRLVIELERSQVVINDREPGRQMTLKVSDGHIVVDGPENDQ